MGIRQELHDEIAGSQELIKKEMEKWEQSRKSIKSIKSKVDVVDTGLVEYYGAKNPEVIFVGMGSMIGTVKDFVDNSKGRVGVLKIRSFRPLPAEDIIKIIKK